MERGHRRIAYVMLLGLLTLMPSALASAQPATPVDYPAGATSTRFAGLAFDTCTAPSLATIRSWNASPYRAIGVYIGGPNRSCQQPQLTASWVGEVTRLGWRLVPIYVNRQAPCTYHTTTLNITPAQASAQGKASAADAVAKANSLGLLPGSALYADMEHYAPDNAACRTTVLQFLSAWTTELHRLGYLSGVYAHLNSGAKHLSDTFASTSFARPDALWIARWDGSSSLTGWSGIPNSRWANGQRGKQYLGDHAETHGGARLTIDSNRFDAPAASLALPYLVTSKTVLNARSGPSTTSPVIKKYQPSATAAVICQTPGSQVASTKVWNKLSDGTYVSDRYISTPSTTGYSTPLPRCQYPYQVSSNANLNRRTGPGTSHAISGPLPPGSLAWVVCQRAGTQVATTAVWNLLADGTWVSDYYVATPSSTSYSTTVPRCTS